MSSRKTKSKTLSDKISSTFTPRSLIDPENDSDDETRPKIVDIDSDDSDYEKITTPKQLSDIRKRNIKLLSEQNDKYHGIISSRKDIEEEVNDDDDDEYEKSDSSDEEENSSVPDNLIEKNNDDSSSDDDNNDYDDLEKYRKKLKNCQIKDEDKDESFSTDDDEETEYNKKNLNNANTDSNEDDDSDYGSSADEEFTTNEKDESETLIEQNLLTESNQIEEINKGLAVQNQLKLWEKLLEVRIHSQKILYKANSLPLPNQYEKLIENNEFVQATKETTENVQNLLDKMLEMQTILTKQYSETKDLLIKSNCSNQKNKKRSSTTTNDLDAPPNKRLIKILDDNFNNFQPYRNTVLQKWHDRTKILTPGAGTKSQSENYDILRKIETVLLNKNDLIEKSQIIKGNFQLFGGEKLKEKNNDEIIDEEIAENNNKKSCPNIYDDTDFYHQQLRELIEFKTNTSANPTEMTKQFAELQKLRQKMKKKVDTRASKGRKIRYVVHNKLVNFMAPNDNSEWTEESKNELFKSLFTE